MIRSWWAKCGRRGSSFGGYLHVFAVYEVSKHKTTHGTLIAYLGDREYCKSVEYHRINEHFVVDRGPPRNPNHYSESTFFVLETVFLTLASGCHVEDLLNSTLLVLTWSDLSGCPIRRAGSSCKVERAAYNVLSQRIPKSIIRAYAYFERKCWKIGLEQSTI